MNTNIIESCVEELLVAPSERRNVFIVNPQSFGGKRGKQRMLRVLAEIHEYFAANSGNYSIFKSLYPRNAIYIIQNYVKTIPEDVPIRIYAIGGDGILYDCLNGAAGLSNCELAAMPFGNTNDFVLAFGRGHNDAFRSVKKQVEAAAIPTDIIKLDGQYAMNFISIGIEGESMMNLTKIRAALEGTIPIPRFLHSLTYLLGGFIGMIRKEVREQYYEVTLDDGQVIAGKGLGVNISNAAFYGGGKSANTVAIPNDGILNLIFVQDSGMISDIVRTATYINGAAYKNAPHYVTATLKKAHIISSHLFAINLDGEVYVSKEALIEILPKFIGFAAPDGLTYLKQVTK